MKSLIIVFLTIFHSHALANDGFGALGVGGVVVGKTDHIALKKEVLELSYKKIQVQYEFVNESDNDIISEVVFPLPPYPASPSETGVVAAGQPINFTITANGTDVRYATQVRASLTGVDITADLRTVGFTDAQIATLPFEKTMQEGHQLPVYISSRTLTALQKKGYMSEDIPTWDIHIAYQWRQTFPARKSTFISHSYAPFIAMGTASGFRGIDSKKFRVEEKRESEDGPGFVKTFCPTEEAIDQLNRLFFNKKNQDVYNELRGTIVNYVLTTANTWKNGVRDFTLRIRAGSPEEVVSTCFPAPLRRESPGVYVARLKNFAPKSDLSVYFGNIKEPDWSKYSYGISPIVNQPMK